MVWALLVVRPRRRRLKRVSFQVFVEQYSDEDVPISIDLIHRRILDPDEVRLGLARSGFRDPILSFPLSTLVRLSTLEEILPALVDNEMLIGRWSRGTLLYCCTANKASSLR
mmetsp:Transcript_12108/g.24673  ORF Transcript_12108/g.24673 Transcript_12108/m.24673 type:complete len:112 (-) Transcript_12108:600-935(-)